MLSGSAAKKDVTALIVAAEKEKSVEAQWELGVYYANDKNSAYDPVKAVSWLHAAALQNHARAQAALGVSYLKGHGVEIDALEAVRWFVKSAEQKNARAQWALGVCFRDGLGVDQNIDEAKKWFIEAEKGGYKKAQDDLGLLLCNEEMPADQIDIFNMFCAAANAGDLSSLYALAVCYRDGKGVQRNGAEAARLFSEAAKRGAESAQFELGNCYYSGLGVQQSIQEALQLFTLAIVNGSTQAADMLIKVKQELVTPNKIEKIDFDQLVKTLIDDAGQESKKRELTPIIRQALISLFHMAVINDQIGDVERFIANGVDLEGRDEEVGKTALQFACMYKYSHIAWLLYENGAKADANDKDIIDGLMPPEIKRARATSDALELRAAQQRTLLRLAVCGGQVETVQALLKQGADYYSADELGNTVLQLALRRSQWSIVQLLIEKGINSLALKPRETIMLLQMVAAEGLVSETLLFRDNIAYINVKDRWERSLLHLAASQGQLKVINYLLRLVDIQAQDHYGNTPLHYAVIGNCADAAGILLNYSKANLEVKNKCGKTPLHCAVEGSDRQVIMCLIVQNANLEATDDDGRTPLHLAVLKGNSMAVDELLRHKPSTNAQDKMGCTALHLAALFGKTEVLPRLIKYGFDLEVRDNGGKTPLCYALSAMQGKAVTILLGSNAKVLACECDDNSDMHIAALSEYNTSIEVIAGFGCAIDIKNKQGRTALHHAVFMGNIEPVKLLLEKGASIDTADNDGQTALHFAILQLNYAMADFLLENDIVVDAVDIQGRSAIHLVAESDDENLFSLLSSHAASLKILDNEGKSSLHYLADHNSLEVMRKLKDKDLKELIYLKDKNGLTALHYAAKLGHVEFTKKLLTYMKENIDIKDNQGNTAFMLAAAEGQKEVLTPLLENGAEIAAYNAFGMCAFHLAAERDQVEVMYFLSDRECRVDVAAEKSEQALHYAARSNGISAIEMLLEEGAEVNAQTLAGSSALHYAAECNQVAAMQLLLQAQLTVDLVDTEGCTALHKAVEKGYLAGAKLLLSIGRANIYARDNQKNTVLHYAVGQRNCSDMVTLILNTTSDLVECQNAQGKTPLHIASTLGNSEAVKLLLNFNANQAVADLEGSLPLHYAISFNQDAIINLLLEVKNVKLLLNVTDVGGRAAIHVAGYYGNQNAVVALHLKGADIEEGDKQGKTVLHYAAEAGHMGMLKYLLALKVGLFNRSIRLNERDVAGMTALHYAAVNNHSDVIELLCANGVKVTAKIKQVNSHTDHRSALHLAAEKGNIKSIAVLCRHNASLEGEDDLGRTPLLIAASNNQCEAIITLCCHLMSKKLLSPNLLSKTDKAGKSVLHYIESLNAQMKLALNFAPESSRAELVKLLQIKGETPCVTPRRNNSLTIDAELSSGTPKSMSRPDLTRARTIIPRTPVSADRRQSVQVGIGSSLNLSPTSAVRRGAFNFGTQNGMGSVGPQEDDGDTLSPLRVVKVPALRLFGQPEQRPVAKQELKHVDESDLLVITQLKHAQSEQASVSAKPGFRRMQSNKSPRRAGPAKPLVNVNRRNSMMETFFNDAMKKHGQTVSSVNFRMK